MSSFKQYGGGKCSTCGSDGTNKSTCPCNPQAKNKKPEKHPKCKSAKKAFMPVAPLPPKFKPTKNQIKNMKNIKEEIAKSQIFNVPGECYGWTTCGKKKQMKGISIIEIPKGTILYRGISSQKDFSVPKYPTYFAEDLSTVLRYAWCNTGRIISFKTTSRIRLLDVYDKITYKYIMDNCDEDCQKLINTAFLKGEGRYSTYDSDEKMIQKLMKYFKWVDGYAMYERSGFHEEIAIFKPDLLLKEISLEYRFSGIFYNNRNITIPFLFKVFKGNMIDSFFFYNLNRNITVWERMDGRGFYCPDKHVIDVDDPRDNFIVDIYKKAGGTSEKAQKYIENMATEKLDVPKIEEIYGYKWEGQAISINLYITEEELFCNKKEFDSSTYWKDKYEQIFLSKNNNKSAIKAYNILKNTKLIPPSKYYVDCDDDIVLIFPKLKTVSIEKLNDKDRQQLVKKYLTMVNKYNILLPLKRGRVVQKTFYHKLPDGDNDSKTIYYFTIDPYDSDNIFINSKTNLIEAGLEHLPLDSASHLKLVTELLEKGVDPNYALNYVSRKGYLKLVKELLAKGVDPNNALFYASRGGNLDVVKELLAKGADPNIKNSNNETPLLYASESGHLEVVKELLARGADPNIKDSYDDRTTLVSVILGGRKLENLEVVKELLKGGADPDIKGGYYGYDAIIEAINEERHPEIVKELVLRSTKNRNNLLSYAISEGHLELVKILLVRGADPNLKDDFDRTPLELANSYINNLEVIKELLANGAIPDDVILEKYPELVDKYYIGKRCNDLQTYSKSDKYKPKERFTILGEMCADLSKNFNLPTIRAMACAYGIDDYKKKNKKELCNELSPLIISEIEATGV